jgi:hypothetical protein
MLYKVVEKFGPFSGEAWQSYIKWRKFEFSSFDSADRMMRPDVFEPSSVEDWDNCVNEDYKFNFITNIGYAKKIQKKYPNSEIIAVDIELETERDIKEGFLGYDIIDSYYDISFLTNWGVEDLEFINSKLQKNGLISDWKTAIKLRDELRFKYSEDIHADECSVWAIYNPL